MALGENSSPGAGDYRESRFAAGAAAAITLGLCLFWALSRLTAGLTFSPWTAALLGHTATPSAPGPARAWAAGALALPWGAEVWRLSAASAVAASAACAALAYVTASAAVRHQRPPAAIAAGLAAAALFALSPGFEDAATRPGPETLTAALALSSIAVFASAVSGPLPAGALVGAGALGGLAAANHASLLWLLPLFLAFGLTRRAGGPPAAAVTALLVASFGAACAAAALGNWWASGMRWPEYLAAGMRAPYPAPGRVSGSWELGAFFSKLPLPPVFLLCAGSAVWAVQRRNAGLLPLAAAAALLLGPLRPLLTNPMRPRFQYYDEAGPALTSLALLWCLAVCGALAMAERLSSRQRARWAPLAALAAFVALCGGALAVRLPPSRGGHAAEAAREILRACPKGSLVLAGTPSLASLLQTAAPLEGRTDLTAAYAMDLLTTPGRRGISVQGRGDLELPAKLRTGGQDGDWLASHGSLAYRAINAAQGAERARVLDVAIWGVVRRHALDAPVCFVGVSSDFVAARAEQAGSVLVYPAAATPQERAVWPSERTLAQPRRAAEAKAAEAVLLSLSSHARLTQRPDEAESLALLAQGAAPDSSAPCLALARALARQGQEGEARDTASDYLRRLPVTLRVEEALRPVARDLDAHEAVLDWKALSGPGLELRSNRELFENTAGALWRFQELSALRTGFEGVVERNPDDAWAHYEYGAVLAELGYFEAALDYALRASELAPKIVGNYFVDDERYDLVRDYQARHFD